MNNGHNFPHRFTEQSPQSVGRPGQAPARPAESEAPKGATHAISRRGFIAGLAGFAAVGFAGGFLGRELARPKPSPSDTEVPQGPAGGQTAPSKQPTTPSEQSTRPSKSEITSPRAFEKKYGSMIDEWLDASSRVIGGATLDSNPKGNLTYVDHTAAVGANEKVRANVTYDEIDGTMVVLEWFSMNDYGADVSAGVSFLVSGTKPPKPGGRASDVLHQLKDNYAGGKLENVSAYETYPGGESRYTVLLGSGVEIQKGSSRPQTGGAEYDKMMEGFNELVTRRTQTIVDAASRAR